LKKGKLMPTRRGPKLGFFWQAILNVKRGRIKRKFPEIEVKSIR